MTRPLTGVAAGLERLPREIIETSVRRFDEMAVGLLVRAIGSPTMTLHTKKGRQPVKMGTKSKVVGDGAQVGAHIYGTPAALWTWVNTGTEPHTIVRERTQSNPNPKPVQHPGSRGKQVWSRAVAEFAAEFPDIAIKALREVVRG